MRSTAYLLMVIVFATANTAHGESYSCELQCIEHHVMLECDDSSDCNTISTAIEGRYYVGNH
jgi:hypothetical protein